MEKARAVDLSPSAGAKPEPEHGMSATSGPLGDPMIGHEYDDDIGPKDEKKADIGSEGEENAEIGSKEAERADPGVKEDDDAGLKGSEASEKEDVKA